MIGRLNHVAIAVRDIAKAAKVYRDTLGAEVSGQERQPAHGVTTVFITLPNTKIELLEPLGENSPIVRSRKTTRPSAAAAPCHRSRRRWNARSQAALTNARPAPNQPM